MKLTLRDLFWLVLVVGTGCAWWLNSTGDEWRAAAKSIHEMQLKPGETGSCVIGGHNYELYVEAKRR